MTIQESVGVLVTYGVESTFGTPAAGGGASQRLRRVSTNVNLQKDTFASNEVRPDQQISSFRHGGQRVAGTLEGELSTDTYDDWLEALLRGTWAAGVVIDEADVTNITIASNVATVGSGNLLTLGLKLGDIIRFTNLSVSANNNVNFRLTALSATTFSTFPAMTDNATDAAFTLTVVGNKLVMGLEKRSYTIEHSYPGIDVARRFDGCRIGGASIRMPPNGIATISFEVMGQKGVILDGSSAPYFTAATAAPNTDVLTGIEGGLRFGGVEQGIVTGLDMQLSLNMNSTPVIGTPYVPDIFYGRSVATGNVSFYLQDKTLVDTFINETEVDIVIAALAAGAEPREFITLNMQRVKLGGAQEQIAADGGVIVSAPFQALLKSGGAGAAFDTSTLVIQRSNA